MTLAAHFSHKTFLAAAEFLLAKASYKAMTGREQKKGSDVLCYQIVLVFYSNMGGVLNGENFDC